MRKIALFAAILLLAVGCSRKTAGPRSVEDFNFDWRFALGDSPAWSNPGFDDSEWRQLHLPHDWSIEGEFSPDNPSGTSGGALPGGIGWYRKHFVTPEGAGNGKTVSVEFDGVFMNSTVYVNGTQVSELTNQFAGGMGGMMGGFGGGQQPPQGGRGPRG